MERKEAIEILNKVNEKLEGMSEWEIFDYMVQNSEAYRKYIYELIKYLGEEQ